MPGNSLKFKIAVGELQQSELFYRHLISHSVDGIVMINESGYIIYCAPSVKKISGYEPEALLDHHYNEFVHPDDLQKAGKAFYSDINGQSVLNYVQIRLKHSDGDWVWCIVRGYNLLEEKPFNSIIVYFTDDTQRREIEDRLRTSEEQLRTLIHNLGQGVVVHDGRGEITICNQAALEMLGLTEDQLLGKTSLNPDWNVIHENGNDFPGDTHPAVLALRTKKQIRNVVMGVYRPVSKDRRWLLVNAEPIPDNNGGINNVIVSFADITTQKKLSQQLIDQELQKQKLLTQATIFGQEKERREIGKELHDNINQHLNTTRLYLEVAKEKANGEVKEMITLSHKSLTDTINEIRMMSQSLVPPTLGDLGLVESVQDLCDALRRAHTFSIEFNCRYFNEEELPGKLRLILFRIVQEQITNIIRHANPGHVMIRLQSDAEYIILTIKDDGKGFDTAHTRRGLGFSNIHNRAELFNGKVEIQSEPGKGCILTVIIPQITDESDTN
ncbi:MAG: PAS domain S-box protein [Sphingobacteriales bacterium]|nr:PAS domain S-box protein [Sphingobacteriales bacterium]